MPNVEKIPATPSRSRIPTRPESKKSKNTNEPTEREQNKESTETVEPTIRAVEPTHASLEPMIRPLEPTESHQFFPNFSVSPCDEYSNPGISTKQRVGLGKRT